MKAAYAALIAVLLVLPVQVDAYYFRTYSENVVLDGDTQHTVHAVFVPQETLTRLSLGTADEPKNVSAILDGKEVQTFVQKTDDTHSIVIQSPDVLSKNVSHQLVLSFVTELGTERTSQGTLYSNAFISDVRMDKYELSVVLPQGAIIAFENDAPLISPTASLSTDGQRTKLVWSDSLRAGESFTALVVYKEENPTAAPIGGGIALIFLAAIAYLAHRKGYMKRLGARVRATAPRKKRPATKPNKHVVSMEKKEAKIPLKSIRETLSQDENKILDIVLQFGGRGLQQDVVRETGWSKSKVSKVLRGLEMKGVLVKQPYGKTNILKLAEKYAS